MDLFEPESIDDFVLANPQSKLTLENITQGKMTFPLFGKNMICLWGAYGTGKTTMALLLPRLIEAGADLAPTKRMKFFEMPEYWEVTACASSNNTAQVLAEVRKRTEDHKSYSPSGWHYEILDEVDMLTAAGHASLKACSTFANSTIFILTTNHPHKLDQGVISRCHLVEMNASKNPNDYVGLGKRFLVRMGLTGNEIPDSDIKRYAEAAKGDLREFGSAIAMIGAAKGGRIPRSQGSSG
jgi:DNA polymerase III delta prime subunit